METGCPTENELLARAAGTLSSDRVGELDAHLDLCAECRMVLAEAAATVAEPTPPPAQIITFTAGELITDRYIVIRWIATGGMGEVYEVHDTWIDEKVALKTIAAAIADDSRALARLKAEVRAARRVTHENVCRVYDLGFCTRDGAQIAFLTMELLRGATLRQWLLTNGPFTYEAARPVIIQMAEALRHAHAAGIVHRDFKSDNVMLIPSPRGAGSRVVVMDFGLARQSLVGAIQPLTPQSRTVFGTLDYMSPEQLMGKPATPASDIYSLGTVVYELLTGRLPFEGESPLARALQRVTVRAPFLAKALPTLPSPFAASVARCLETKPEARLSTMEDFLGELAGKPAPQPHLRRTLAALVAALSIGSIGVLASASFKRGARITSSSASVPAPRPTVRRSQASEAALSVTPVDVTVVSMAETGVAPAPMPPAQALKRSRSTPLAARAGAVIVPIASAASTSPAPSAAATTEPTIAVRPTTPSVGTRDALLDPFASPAPAERPR